MILTATAATAAEPESEGWRHIFDGKSLEGWKVTKENRDGWTVEDGTIVGRGGRSHLYYVAEEFDDFEWRADILTQPQTNSGMYVHTRYLESGWPNVGHEVQVNVTHRDPVKTGSIYGVVKLYETPAQDKKWWTQHISVKGQNIVVRINGKIVVDYTEPRGAAGMRKLSQGLIAFQQHDPGSVVRYRNVMVRTAKSAAAAEGKNNVHAFTMQDIDGNQKSLGDFKGRAVLMVNVASRCGYTPQYEGLQALYEQFKDKGLVVLGVPSNDFGKQEPGTAKQIKEFCTSKFGVTFPMLAKVSVKNGAEQCELYRYLTSKQANGVLDAKVAWNFNKFLIGKDGRPIKHYASKVAPDAADLRADIEAALH